MQQLWRQVVVVVMRAQIQAKTSAGSGGEGIKKTDRLETVFWQIKFLAGENIERTILK